MTEPKTTSPTHAQVWAAFLGLWTSEGLPAPHRVTVFAGRPFPAIHLDPLTMDDYLDWSTAVNAKQGTSRKPYGDGSHVISMATGSIGDCSVHLVLHEELPPPAADRAELDAALSAAVTALGDPS